MKNFAVSLQTAATNVKAGGFCTGNPLLWGRFWYLMLLVGLVAAAGNTETREEEEEKENFYSLSGPEEIFTVTESQAYLIGLLNVADWL